jgi:hypothetical protein
MFIVLREEVGDPEGAIRHFFKKRGGALPLIHMGEIDAVYEDEKADQERRRKDKEPSYKSTYPPRRHGPELSVLACHAKYLALSNRDQRGRRGPLNR